MRPRIDIADVILALCDEDQWDLALELARAADAWNRSHGVS